MRRYADWLEMPIVRWARWIVLWLAQLLIAFMLLFAWLLLLLLGGWPPLAILRAAGRCLQLRILTAEEIFDEKKALEIQSAAQDPADP